MRLSLSIAAGMLLLGAAPAVAGAEFGAPDFSNYLSRPGLVSCDWQYPSYWRACPTPDLPPKPPAATPTTAKRKP